MAAGDLSTQRFNRDEYLSLITTGSPARDDDSGRQHTVIRRGPNWPKRCPAPVISTEAERSGEISRPMVQGAWRQEFSRPKVSRDPGLPIPAGSSARDDQWACILPSENRYGKKGCEEMICMSSRSFLVGEIPWGCEVMAHHRSFLPIPSHPCLWGINLCKNKVLDRKKAFSYNKEKG